MCRPLQILGWTLLLLGLGGSVFWGEKAGWFQVELRVPPPPSERDTGITKDFLHPGETVAPGWVLSSITNHTNARKVFLAHDLFRWPIYFSPSGTQRGRVLERFPGCIALAPFLPPDAEAGFRKAVHELGNRFPPGYFDRWKTLQSPSNWPGRCYQAAYLALVLLLILRGVLALRHIATEGCWTEVGRGIESRILPWTVVLAAGLFVRIYLSPWAPLHHNHHGNEHLDHLVLPEESPYPDYYGRAHEAFFDLVTGLAPPRVESVFVTNIALGLAACAAGGWAAWVLFQAPWAGLWTGTFLALSPQMARVSTSESSFVLAALLLALGLGGWAEATRSPKVLPLLQGLLGIGLAVQLHAATAGLLALPLVFFLFWKREEGPPSNPLPILGGFFILALLALPHFLFIWSSQGSEGLAKLPFVFRSLSTENFFLNPSLTPLLLPVLGLLGAWRLFHTQKPLLVIVAGGYGALGGCYLLANSLSDVIRYQSLPALILLLLSGLGASVFVSLRKHPWQRIILGAGILCALVFSSRVPYQTVLAPTSEAQEFLFLRDTLRLLPRESFLTTAEGTKTLKEYVPKSLLFEGGSGREIIPASQVPYRFEKGLQGLSVYLFEGLTKTWLETAANGDNEQRRGEALPALEALEKIKRSNAKLLTSKRITPTSTGSWQGPPDFHLLPAEGAEVSLYKLD